MVNIYIGYDIGVLGKMQFYHIGVLLRASQYDIDVLSVRHKRVENALETSRATKAQCFRQIEGRPLDRKSVGQTVSYGGKIGMKYHDVKIYDVLDGFRKGTKILSY